MKNISIMDKKTYNLIENYMLSCMEDSAHDREHVYRVLFNALEIAKTESGVDYDVLITACLLHDIGRKEQFENPALCHAEVGAEKARRFLAEHHFDGEFIEKVARCILCHRFRNDRPPRAMEEKILFDADKLDVTGAVGIARTLVYKGQVAEPLYRLDENGQVSNGEKDTQASFFREYKFKLENIYGRFYTRLGAELARKNRGAAVDFYQSLLGQVSGIYSAGREELARHVEDTAQ